MFQLLDNEMAKIVQIKKWSHHHSTLSPLKSLPVISSHIVCHNRQHKFIASHTISVINVAPLTGRSPVFTGVMIMVAYIHIPGAITFETNMTFIRDLELPFFRSIQCQRFYTKSLDFFHQFIQFFKQLLLWVWISINFFAIRDVA